MFKSFKRTILTRNTEKMLSFLKVSSIAGAIIASVLLLMASTESLHWIGPSDVVQRYYYYTSIAALLSLMPFSLFVYINSYLSDFITNEELDWFSKEEIKKLYIASRQGSLVKFTREFVVNILVKEKEVQDKSSMIENKWKMIEQNGGQQ